MESNFYTTGRTAKDNLHETISAEQDEYSRLSDLLDSLLSLETSARTSAATHASKPESVRAAEVADIYASAAAAVAELKERRTIAAVYEAERDETIRSLREALDRMVTWYGGTDDARASMVAEIRRRTGERLSIEEIRDEIQVAAREALKGST